MSNHLGGTFVEQLSPYLYFVCCEQNQRENNEDSFQIFQIVPKLNQLPITVLCVADGMGGHAFGEDVSREALKKLSLALFEKLTVDHSLNQLEILSPIDSKTISLALYSALEQANAHVRRMVEANKWGKAGSTIVVAVIVGEKAVVAYLGDSPMFHYQTNQKKLTKVTKDHTVAGVLLRAGMITEEMARYHEGRSRLEFYVGCPNFPTRESPMCEVALSHGDLLLLCSDGVSGVLTEEQITKILTDNSSNLEMAAKKLMETAREAGETDNQTLILWHHFDQSHLHLDLAVGSDELKVSESSKHKPSEILSYQEKETEEVEKEIQDTSSLQSSENQEGETQI